MVKVVPGAFAIALAFFLSGIDAMSQCAANAGGPVSGVCAGGTVVLGGSPAATGDGPFSYSWSPANGLSSTTVPDPVLTVPHGTSTYTLTITDAGGCSASAQVTVTALSTPQIALGSPDGHPDLHVAAGGGSFALCGSGLNSYDFRFTDNSTAMPGAAFSMDWGYPPNGPTPVATGWTEDHTYPVGLHTMVYSITNPNGCSATRSISVFLGSNPSVGTSNPGNTVLCSGTELVFPINNTVNNSPGTQYVVTYGDGNFTSFTHPPPASVTYDYPGTNCPGAPFTFRIDAITPCPITSFATAGPIYITDVPQASFSISPNDTACVGSQVTFSDTSLGLSGTNCGVAPQRVWSITPATGHVVTGNMGGTNGSSMPNQWSSGSSALGVRFTEPGPYCISLLVGNNMCGTDVVERCVCIEGPPVPDAVLAPAVGCVPLLSDAENLSNAPDACSVRYEWDASGTGDACGTGAAWEFAGGTGAASFEPRFRFTQPGNYSVRLRAINSCGTFTHTMPVVVGVPPQVSLAPLPGICAQDCVTPSATVQACGAPITGYAWVFPNGIPANADVAVPGQVCFDTPGGSTVSVTVSNACGSATANANLAVGTLPLAPVISSNSPVCQGQTLSLTAASSPGVSYVWSGPGGFSSTQSSFTIDNVTAVHAGTYTVIAVSGGCSGPPSSVDVVVVPAPAVTVSAPSTTICAGQSTTLTATGAGNYQWYIGTNQVGSGPAFTTSPAITTTYTLTGSTGGCPGSTTVTVTVHPLPVVNAGAPLTLCDQAVPVTLTGSPSPGTWSGPVVTPGGIFTPIPDSLGLHTLTYTHTNANGCTNSASVGVTVEKLTLIADAGPDTALCVGTVPVQLPHSPPGGTWTGAGPGGVFVPGTVGEHVLTYSHGSGTCATTDQVRVEVLPAPVLTVQAGIERCADAAPVALQADPAGGTWSGAGVDASGLFDPAAVAPGQHVLTYSYSDGSGCTSTAQTVAAVHPLPVVDAGPDLVLCDQPIAHQLGGAPAGGTWSSSWMNVTSAGAITPGGTGTDDLVYLVVDAYGCSAGDVVRVDVVELDQPAIAPPDTSICIASGALQFNGMPAGGVWSGPHVDATGLFLPGVAGAFTLTYSVGAGTCLTMDQIAVTVEALPGVDAGTGIAVCLGDAPQVLVAAPAGGTWSGTGVDPATGVFDPGQVLPGGNPVTYTYTDPLTGCTASDDALVTVHPLPAAGFTHAPVACAGAGHAFSNTSTGGATAQWTFGDGGSSQDLSPTYTYMSPGVHDVTLVSITDMGCSDTLTSTVEVWAVPQVQFALSVDSGCGPLEVAFFNGSSGEGLGFMWDFGGSAVSTERDPPPFSFLPDPQQAIVHVVSLTAYNVCGSAVSEVPVLVIPAPTAVFGPGVDTYCSHAEVSFGNASFGDPSSFQWDLGDGTQSDSQAPVVTHAYVAGDEPTEFTITLVALNACGSDTAQRTITVLPNEVTAFFNTDPVQGCAPLTVELTRYSSGDTAWVWDLGDGNGSLAHSLQHTYVEPGTYTITLSGYGCGFDEHTAEVTVYPLPAVEFATAPATVCAGEPFTFTDLTPNTVGVVWDLGDGNVSTLSEVSHTYAVGGTYQVTLTATSAPHGCTASLTRQVAVRVTPAASFGPLPASGCAQLAVQFQNTTQNGTFFSWDLGDGNTSVADSPSHVYVLPGTYDIVLVAENLNGCSDTAFGQVVVHPRPVAGFLLDAYESCTVPIPVSTFNTSVGAVGFGWDLGNGGTSTLNEPVIVFDQAGDHTVRLVAMNQFGCADTATAVFVAHPTPVAGFSVLPQPACVGGEVSFIDGSLHAMSHLWYFGDGASSTASAPSHVFGAPGLYDVVLIVTGAGGCSDTLAVQEGVHVHPAPLAGFSMDTMASAPNVFRFTDLSVGGASRLWDFGDGTSSGLPDPVHMFPGDGGGYTVCLTVENSFGCMDAACQYLVVPADPEVYVPNAFTPNGDGVNDVFLPVLNGFFGWEYRLTIFDRWGAVLHETRDPGRGWNGRSRGRDVQVGVYVWKLELESSGDIRDFTGHVSLVR